MNFSLGIQKNTDGMTVGCLVYTVAGDNNRYTTYRVVFDLMTCLLDIDDTNKPFLLKETAPKFTLWRLTKKDWAMIDDYIEASYSKIGCLDFCARFFEFKARYSLNISEKGNQKYMMYSCSAPPCVTAAILHYYALIGLKLRRCVHCKRLFFSDTATREDRYCNRLSPMLEYEDKTCGEAVKKAMDDSGFRRFILNPAKRQAYEYGYDPKYSKRAEDYEFPQVQYYIELKNEHEQRRQAVFDDPTPENVYSYIAFRKEYLNKRKGKK